MTATNHTEHYGLSQYAEDDHPTYTGDYNSDMSKIDAAIYAASQSGGGGMATVEHTADLTGDGTASSPLGVADTIARTEDIPSLDGYATTESVTQAIAAAIADRLTAGDIKAGNGINIQTSGNQVTISYVGGGSSGGLAAVAHDATLTGDGTSGNPLGAGIGSALNPYGVNGAVDANMSNDGIMTVTYNTANLPTPTGTARGFIIGYHGGLTSPRFTQLLVSCSKGSTPRIFARGSEGSTFDEWTEFAAKADIPDVSALTSRIDALEQQVSALTAAAAPSATGLTAEQLDSQYSDGYNIVRVGTPTQLNESEVNPNE